MTKTQKLAEQLQDTEIKVLNYLNKHKSGSVDSVSSELKLQNVAVGRAAMYLENKGLVKQDKTKFKIIKLDKNGKKYAKSVLPEFKFLKLVKEKPLSIDALRKKMPKDEVAFSLGYLKKKGLIIIDKDKVKPVPVDKPKKSEESKLIKKLAKSPVKVKDLSKKQKEAYKKLRRRKVIITVSDETTTTLKITKKGKSVAKKAKKISKNRIGKLTKSVLKTGKWKKKKFRRYDVKAPVPKLKRGKPHPYLSFLEEVRNELTSMGFEEMTGPNVESSFFCLDALYMPQNHPARGIHDQYFVEGEADLGKYRSQLSEVKQTHEKGGDAGSTGWRGEFSTKEAKKLLLRSQGTALSARTLIKAAEQGIEKGKYFSIARCYRPDVVDKTHLTEFNQMEGIVIGDDLNFSQLLGMLKQFAQKVADTDKVKFVPGYFPFTEPSVEGFIYHPKLKKWIEVLPAGILRPEVTVPLGINKPVLAWGLGIDRLFMIRENIDDIRKLFSDDLKYLREAEV